MTDDMDRRRFLKAVPAAVALTAGCQGDSTTTDTREPTDEETSTAAATATPEPSTATPVSTPADEPAGSFTGATETIGTEVLGDVLTNHPTRARVIREFLPQASAASIAVAFPEEMTDTRQALCFDAATCRVQYAWSGGFIKIPYVKDDGPAAVEGQSYYQPDRGFPLRFDGDSEPEEFSFEGYSLGDRLPEFRYVADGVTVYQHFSPLESGRGFRQRFRLPGRSDPVRFVTDPDAGVGYESEAGSWEGDHLVVEGDDLQEFTVEVHAE